MFRKINREGSGFRVPSSGGAWVAGITMLLLACFAGRAWGQPESRLDHYMSLAHPIGTASLAFPGPDGGYTFVHLPTKELMEWGDTEVNPRTYLLDLNISHEGLYIAPDTMLDFSQYTQFQFVLPGNHIIHAKLAPSHTHQDYLAMDTNFNGTLGWGLIKQFITVFDFKRNLLTFYPLYSSVIVADDDTNVIQLPIIDDARITYCHCPVSTVWLDVQAPPLIPGHVNLAFQQPRSEVYLTALDSNTRQIVNRQIIKDSLAHDVRPIGLNLGQFIVHDLAGHAINLASHGPHRAIVPLLDIYHDLTVPVLGALGTDVLRTFSGIIIDPSRNKLIFVK